MKWLITVGLTLLLMGCGADNALTKAEKDLQENTQTAVAEILFDSELDTKASYNVRKDGHVHIEFTPDVSMIQYTRVVEKMRSHPNIKSVYAEQSGGQVCGIR